MKQPNSSHCFVCGLANPFGLKLEFHQTAAGEVTVWYTVPEQYQSYPGQVHGGIVASMLDEVLMRVHMGSDPDNTRFMYTAKMTVKYRKPVPIGKPLRIVGWAEKSKERSATSTAAVYGPDGDVLAEAEGLLVDVPPDLLKNFDPDTLGWQVYSEGSTG